MLKAECITKKQRMDVKKMELNYIDKEFPGGNIQVNSIHKDEIHIEQEIRDSGEWWFYWCFCAKNLAGRTIRFIFDNGEVLGPYGPSVSADGIHWRWAGAGSLINRSSFIYEFTKEEEEVYFSFSIPYQIKYFELFKKKLPENQKIVYDVLGISEKGRQIPCMRFGNVMKGKHIYFTCRHHACESTAAYMLEGTVEYLLEQREDFLEKYCIHIFPFVDVDGVEDGDQGKARRPHDHNRDYIDEPIYNFTHGMYQYVKKYQPYVFADYHSPWKWGDRNDVFFLVKNLNEMERHQEMFADILEMTVSRHKGLNGIPYNKEDNIDGDVEWNTGCSPTSTKYFINQGVHLAIGFEVPYFGANGVVYTADRLRWLGRSVGESFIQYCCVNMEN